MRRETYRVSAWPEYQRLTKSVLTEKVTYSKAADGVLLRRASQQSSPFGAPGSPSF